MRDKKQVKKLYLMIKETEDELLESFKNIIVKRNSILKFSYKNYLLYESVKKSGKLDIFWKDLKNNNDRIVKLSIKFCKNNNDIIELYESISNKIFETLLSNNIDENVINEKMKLLNHRILEYKKIQNDTKNCLKNIWDEIYE